MAETDMEAGPGELQQYLSDADYPCSRDDLVSRALERDAPDSVVKGLERLPDQTYDSFADVSKAWSKADAP